MFRGGKPSRLASSPDKTGSEQRSNCASDDFSAPGSVYGDGKIRRHNLERTRIERLRTADEGEFKSLIRHGWNRELIEVADKKSLHNRIKTMVDREMKANEHLFREERQKKPEFNVEHESKQINVPVKSVKEKEDELKIIEEEEERKLVEEKRLQLFIENSEELRSAAMAKRKKEIDTINYKTIQEKEKASKDEKVKRREMANLEILKFGRIQTFEKNEERRKMIEKKQRFRMELNKQVQEKEKIQKHENELKNIESMAVKTLNEHLNKEEELEKLERVKKRARRNEEIKRFNEERAKLLSQMTDSTNVSNATSVTMTSHQGSKDDGVNLKARLRNEYEMFMRHDAMIKEERKRQNAEMANTMAKQRDEIEKLKRSVERENDEVRRKRAEEGNKALGEQLKSRETLLEAQKIAERQAHEQSTKQCEGYLEAERRLSERKKQLKWQVKNDLMDQIKSRKDVMEKQRETDLEFHRKYMKELAEQEDLLHKLLNKL